MTVSVTSLPTWDVRHGDCVAGMATLPDGFVNLACLDPPYNIGVDYDAHDDNMSPEDYCAWAETWLQEIYRVLHKHGTFWLIIGDEYVSDLDVLARSLGFHKRSHVIWHYTFGVSCAKNFARSHTHCLYFVKAKTKFTFNHKDPEIRVPSARQLVYKDKRANPDGKLPDNTWILHPDDLEKAFPEESDTWLVSRVCGTFKERQSYSPNQLPLKLLDRIILACSNPGDLVLDPFSGSASTGASALTHGRRYLGFELSETVAEHSRDRLRNVHHGEGTGEAAVAAAAS